MPTSNSGQQATDTNNNRNNKIFNGSAQELLVVTSEEQQQVLVMPPPMASPESILTIPAALASAAAVAVVAPPVPPRPPSITALKQQNPITSSSSSSINSNNNSKNNNNNNNISNHNNINNSGNNNVNNNHTNNNSSSSPLATTKTKALEDLAALIKDVTFDRTSLSNEELIRLVKSNHISIYKLESFLGKDNASRCVEVRRDFYRLELAELDKLDQLGIRDRADALLYPKYKDLDYERVNGACCENVIGHVKVPVGLAGPLILDGEEIFVPLATTEGCLVASTCRGLSALRKSGGVTSRIRRDFMTRAPIIRFKDVRLRDALDNVERAIRWLNDKNNKEKMRAAFNLTSSHGRFINYTMYPVSREIHIRFEAQTGDAMGMNMCSKGVESALKEMQRAFPSMEIVTLSGNMCTDKKAAGINWINGRGKAVECNAELPANVVKQVFKVSVDQLVDRWKSKVMIGSALAASIGGFNSQAANILTAIFIATGQDPAQNVTSSNCMLILEKDSKGSLVVCCTMPSIECGTVGGGTILGDQSRYLQMMGVRGPTPKLKEHLLINGCIDLSTPPTSGQFINYASAPSPSSSAAILQSSLPSSSSSSSDLPSIISSSSTYINTNEYTNARKLARIICATVMAGELSLLAALTEGTLVKSHMRHNRSSTNVITSSSSVNNLNQIISGGVGGGGSGGAAAYGDCVSPSNLHSTINSNQSHQLYHNNTQTLSCFGPLASINNTTVINHHRPSYNNNNNHYLNNDINNSNFNSLDNCDADEIGSNCSATYAPQPGLQQQQQNHGTTNHFSYNYNNEINNLGGGRSSGGAGVGGGGGGGVSSSDTLARGDNIRLC